MPTSAQEEEAVFIETRRRLALTCLDDLKQKYVTEVRDGVRWGNQYELHAVGRLIICAVLLSERWLPTAVLEVVDELGFEKIRWVCSAAVALSGAWFWWRTSPKRRPLVQALIRYDAVDEPAFERLLMKLPSHSAQDVWPTFEKWAETVRAAIVARFGSM